MQRKGGNVFVDKVRNYLRNGKGLKKAVDLAIDECIEEDVLKKFFENRKDEVRKVMDWDWMMERHIRSMKEEEREEGRLEGRLEGRQEGIRRLIIQIQKKINKGKTLSEIADDLEMEESAISEIYDQIMKIGVDCSTEEIVKRISSEDAMLLLK